MSGDPSACAVGAVSTGICDQNISSPLPPPSTHQEVLCATHVSVFCIYFILLFSTICELGQLTSSVAHTASCFAHINNFPLHIYVGLLWTFGNPVGKVFLCCLCVWAASLWPCPPPTPMRIVLVITIVIITVLKRTVVPLFGRISCPLHYFTTGNAQYTTNFSLFLIDVDTVRSSHYFLFSPHALFSFLVCFAGSCACWCCTKHCYSLDSASSSSSLTRLTSSRKRSHEPVCSRPIFTPDSAYWSTPRHCRPPVCTKKTCTLVQIYQ